MPRSGSTSRPDRPGPRAPRSSGAGLATRDPPSPGGWGRGKPPSPKAVVAGARTPRTNPPAPMTGHRGAARDAHAGRVWTAGSQTNAHAGHGLPWRRRVRPQADRSPTQGSDGSARRALSPPPASPVPPISRHWPRPAPAGSTPPAGPQPPTCGSDPGALHKTPPGDRHGAGRHKQDQDQTAKQPVGCLAPPAHAADMDPAPAGRGRTPGHRDGCRTEREGRRQHDEARHQVHGQGLAR